MRPPLTRAEPYWHKHLLPGERTIVAVRQHWVRLLEPAGTSTAMLILAIVVDSNTSPRTAIVADICWALFWVAVLRTVWRWAQWRHDTFVATDKRLLLSYGLITRRVAMMPLLKVTDMSYNRSPLGQLLGYGQFVLESAGQEQALRQVDFVPHPDRNYRQICQEIFGATDPDDLPATGPPPGDANSDASLDMALDTALGAGTEPGEFATFGERPTAEYTGTLYRSGQFDDAAATRPIPISEWPGRHHRGPDKRED